MAAPGAEPVAAAATVLASFLRIVTHPRIFREPDTMADALEFVAALRGGATYVEMAPDARHWAIFTDLCRAAGVRGNLVPDAYLAALAIETGSTWVTTDRDFARFPGLCWQHPLDS